MSIKRLHDRDESGEQISLAVFSLTLPQQLAYEVDALCVFTGQGEDARVIQPIKAYWENEKTKNRFLLVPGYHKDEHTWREITKETLSQKPFEIKRLKGLHVSSSFVTTRDQAQWAIEKVKELGITSCGILSSQFHLVRAYATTLACMHAADIKIPIIPIPIYVAPSSVIPETAVTAWDMLQGEVERISAYQKKGDVISYEKFREYIDWLWEQQIIKNNV
ncbi:MAG: hypothetical protein Q7S75_03230 [bacterium]|nr:hypothetical protein [bacterium]